MSSVRPVAYAGTALGLLASLAANVEHVISAPGDAPAAALVGAAFWPLALLLSSEVLARKRWAGRWARRAGIVSVLVVALVAAVISYGHIAALLSTWGESMWAAHLGPLAVDGLMVVSSLALVAADAPEPAVGCTPAPAAGSASGSGDTVHPASPADARPVAPSGAPAGLPQRTPKRTSNAPARRTDDELRAALAELPGPHSARGVAAALRISQRRASGLLTSAREA